MLQNYEQEDAFEFIVRLCHDVLMEVLIFGERRRLTKLERVGRRFHLTTEHFFRERPFLRLGLEIYSYFLNLFSLKYISNRQKNESKLVNSLLHITSCLFLSSETVMGHLR